jgi:hypothetical protein
MWFRSWKRLTILLLLRQELSTVAPLLPLLLLQTPPLQSHKWLLYPLLLLLMILASLPLKICQASYGIMKQQRQATATTPASSRSFASSAF